MKLSFKLSFRARCNLTLLFLLDALCCILDRRNARSLGHRYGPGEGEIWMDNLGCTGSETDLADCQHNGFAQHNCGHNEDVSILCDTSYGRPTFASQRFSSCSRYGSIPKRPKAITAQTKTAHKCLTCTKRPIRKSKTAQPKYCGHSEDVSIMCVDSLDITGNELMACSC